jgi:hypothetical protein
VLTAEPRFPVGERAISGSKLVFSIFYEITIISIDMNIPVSQMIVKVILAICHLFSQGALKIG